MILDDLEDDRIKFNIEQYYDKYAKIFISFIFIFFIIFLLILVFLSFFFKINKYGYEYKIIIHTYLLIFFAFFMLIYFLCYKFVIPKIILKKVEKLLGIDIKYMIQEKKRENIIFNGLKSFNFYRLNRTERKMYEKFLDESADKVLQRVEEYDSEKYEEKIEVNIEINPKEFKINEFITVKLEWDDELYKTNIYVKGVKFIQCKYLLLNVNTNKPELYENIESIDDLEGYYDKRLENSKIDEITPEVEFQAHCSNLQAWAENDYDTRLLHTNISFPLLKKLCEAGDLKAKKSFKEEIINRYVEGKENVRRYLSINSYLYEFSVEELKVLIDLSIKRFKFLKIDYKNKNVYDDLIFTNKIVFENDKYFMEYYNNNIKNLDLDKYNFILLDFNICKKCKNKVHINDLDVPLHTTHTLHTNDEEWSIDEDWDDIPDDNTILDEDIQWDENGEPSYEL